MHRLTNPLPTFLIPTSLSLPSVMLILTQAPLLLEHSDFSDTFVSQTYLGFCFSPLRACFWTYLLVRHYTDPGLILTCSCTTIRPCLNPCCHYPLPASHPRVRANPSCYYIPCFIVSVIFSYLASVASLATARASNRTPLIMEMQLCPYAVTWSVVLYSICPQGQSHYETFT
jgi:hypothetical protein